jgi:D-alanyl-lipoteichoic acid acyltransferase DltB (MBOAT superfamily)
LLLMSSVVDWHVAKRIHAADEQAARKRWLVLSLAVNLGALGIFKYSGFLLDNIVSAAAVAGWQLQFAAPDIILPMGISFYTFQTLSYSIDVYRRKIEPSHSFRDYAMFVSFFPQLVAGPIVRAAEFLPQCEKPKRFEFDAFSLGLTLLLIGLMEKVFLADSVFGPLVDRVYAHQGPVDSLSAWAGGTFFTMQIFCDFAGYSLCAIGVGKMLGFRLPLNFNAPFAAVGFSDFWRRWHISLSSWLRDYLYISLGGNRGGKSRTLRNLMITMLLGGLWHGAAWTFVAWGFLHGLLLVIERLLKSVCTARLFQPGMVQRFVYRLLTLAGVILCFTIFRAENFSQAASLWGAMLGAGGAGDTVLQWNLQLRLAAACFLALVAVQFLFSWRDLFGVIRRSPFLLRGLAMAACILLIVLSGGQSDGFIYFQF